MQSPRRFPGFLVPGIQGGGIDDRVLPSADPTLPARLQHALDATLATVDSSVRHGVIAGVIMPGLGTWTGASGFSHDDVPMTADMRMEVGSVTKTFIARATFKLIEEGKLTLDDSLGMWLPPYPNVDGAVTVRQLLSHSSGIYDYVNDDTTHTLTADAYFHDPEKVWTPEEILQHIGTPHFKAGTKTLYSNTNYLLLGMLIEKASGNSAADEIRRRFLTPLGMHDTYLGWAESIEGELAHGWVNGLDTDPAKQVDIASIPVAGGLSLANTAGGLVTTARDLVSWADALYGRRVLDSASMKSMLAIKSTSTEGDIGLGVFRWQYNGKYLYGHDGAVLGFSSWMFSIPRDTVSVVVLLNSLHDDKDIGMSAITAALLQEIYRNVAAVADGERGSSGTMLRQNAPNPFTSETSVGFELPARGHATLEVFDALGRRVAAPVDGILDEGEHTATVSLEGSPSGTYFYVLRTDRGREVKAMRLER